MFRLHRYRSARSQLRWLRGIVDRYGRARFVAFDLSGRRLCYKLRDLLPPEYEALVEDPNPDGGGPGARVRYQHQEVRLWVSRVGGPDRRPRSEDPHQRALGSLNPTVPDADPADG